MSGKSRSSSSASVLVHSFPATPQSVETGTSNAPRTPQTRDSSTDDSDVKKQTSEGTYRPTVSTLAIQRAASHRRKHEAKFACPYPNCNSSFTTARNLQSKKLCFHYPTNRISNIFPLDHENSHRNAKNFTCSVCHLAMATRSNVLRHGKKKHPGQGLCTNSSITYRNILADVRAETRA